MAAVDGRLREHEVTIPEEWVRPEPDKPVIGTVKDSVTVAEESRAAATEAVGELLEELGSGHEWPEGTRSFPIVRDW